MLPKLKYTLYGVDASPVNYVRILLSQSQQKSRDLSVRETIIVLQRKVEHSGSKSCQHVFQLQNSHARISQMYVIDRLPFASSSFFFLTKLFVNVTVTIKTTSRPGTHEISISRLCRCPNARTRPPNQTFRQFRTSQNHTNLGMSSRVLIEAPRPHDDDKLNFALMRPALKSVRSNST